MGDVRYRLLESPIHLPIAMKKQIPIDELQPGMQIDKLDRSWLNTPFFRHRMTVTSFEQIAQLKASGVRTLVVNL
ncbi:MAG: DUF3391 domain-containing protein, partial [Nitrospira sp.]